MVLNGIIMVPPFRLLRIFITCFNIQGIVYRPLLIFTTTEHWHDGKADTLHTMSWWPVFSQNRKANMAITINMGMYRNVISYKHYLRCIKRVFAVEFKIELEVLSFIQGAICSTKVNSPVLKVLACSVRVDWESRRRISHKCHQFFLKSSLPAQGVLAGRFAGRHRHGPGRGGPGPGGTDVARGRRSPCDSRGCGGGCWRWWRWRWRRRSRGRATDRPSTRQQCRDLLHRGPRSVVVHSLHRQTSAPQAPGTPRAETGLKVGVVPASGSESEDPLSAKALPLRL